MEPTNDISNFQPQPSGIPFKVIIIAAVAVVTVIVALVMSFSSPATGGFKVVDTNPALDKIVTITPALTINFNEELTDTDLRVSSQDNIASSPKISGKSLTVSFNAPFTVNRTYSITIDSITSASGHKISGKKISFTPQKTDYNNVPKDQAQTLMQQQVERPYTRDSINFSYDQELIKNGVSVDQVASFKQAVFLYSSKLKKQFSAASIDPASVSPQPVDPESASSVLTIDFKLTIDGAVYKAKLDYDHITAARLYLYNLASGAALYDSGMIDLTK